MTKLLMVGLGGFIGSVARHGVTVWMHRLWPAAALPVGTLVVNLGGCFLIGVLGVGVETRSLFSPEVRALLAIGVLGGFTTFSTFAYETMALGRGGPEPGERRERAHDCRRVPAGGVARDRGRPGDVATGVNAVIGVVHQLGDAMSVWSIPGRIARLFAPVQYVACPAPADRSKVQHEPLLRLHRS